MNAIEALEKLHALPLQPLRGIPRLKGIYALADHEHIFRYVGSTGDKDFRDRIQNRHVAGSEANSHKFSWAYNTGRMYRGPRTEDREIEADRKAAKDLRRAFIRKHCRAVWLPLDLDRGQIETLEREMIRLAPAENAQWNRERFQIDPPGAPDALVDALIAELGLRNETLARLDRQAERYAMACARAA